MSIEAAGKVAVVGVNEVMKKPPKFSEGLKAEAENLARLITLHCVRNTFIEDLHSGTFPGSKIGDYSDVKVVTPYGEIPWNEISRISDDEMKILNKEVLNKLFTFLLWLQKEAPPVGPEDLYLPANWDPAEVDKPIKGFWDRARDRENEK